jgi:hypothetical protein
MASVILQMQLVTQDTPNSEVSLMLNWPKVFRGRVSKRFDPVEEMLASLKAPLQSSTVL